MITEQALTMAVAMKIVLPFTNHHAPRNLWGVVVDGLRKFSHVFKRSIFEGEVKKILYAMYGDFNLENNDWFLSTIHVPLCTPNLPHILK